METMTGAVSSATTTPTTGTSGTSINTQVTHNQAAPGTQAKPNSPKSPESSNSTPGNASKAQTPPSQTPAAELFELKVNGKVQKMTRQEVLDLASMSHAANQKFDEASKQRKAAEKIINTAKGDPIKALMDPALGLSKEQVRDYFEKWYLKEFVETEQLSPDQKRIRELEAIVNRSKEDEEEKIRVQRQSEEEEMTNKQRTFLQNQIIEGLEKSGLPKSKEIVKRMAFYMRQNLVNGWDAPMDMIIRQVKQDHQAMIRDDVQNASIEQIVEIYGEDLINKIRQWDLKRLREKRSAPAPEFGTKPGGDGYGNEERISSHEVQKRLNEMRTGKRSY